MRLASFPFPSQLVALAAAILLPSGCGGEGPQGPGPDSPGEVRSVESEQSATGRIGSHGMILAGDPGNAVLSHIPMFGPPHDVQLIVHGAMTLDPSKLLPKTFSDRPYTFLPERTSLDALRTGLTRELRGTIFLGNFEQGGRPVASGVRFAVDRVVHQHILTSAPPAPPAELSYLLFGSRAQAFAVHFIAAAPSFDEVVTVTLGAGAPSDADLARGVIAHATGTAESLSSRLGARTSPAGMTLKDGTQAFAVHPVATLSCLTGPDFVGACN